MFFIRFETYFHNFLLHFVVLAVFTFNLFLIFSFFFTCFHHFNHFQLFFNLFQSFFTVLYSQMPKYSLSPLQMCFDQSLKFNEYLLFVEDQAFKINYAKNIIRANKGKSIIYNNKYFFSDKFFLLANTIIKVYFKYFSNVFFSFFCKSFFKRFLLSVRRVSSHHIFFSLNSMPIELRPNKS